MQQSGDDSAALSAFFEKPYARSWLLPWTLDGDGSETVQPTAEAFDDSFGYGLDARIHVRHVGDDADQDADSSASAGFSFAVRRLLIPLATVDARYVLGHVYENKDDLIRCTTPGIGGGPADHPPSTADEVLTHRFWIDLRDFGTVQACMVLSSGRVFLSRNIFCRQRTVVFAETLACAPVPRGQLPTVVTSAFRVTQDCPFCLARGQRCECQRQLRLRLFGRLTGGRSIADLLDAAAGKVGATVCWFTKHHRETGVMRPGVSGRMYRSPGTQVGQACTGFEEMRRAYLSVAVLKEEPPPVENRLFWESGRSEEPGIGVGEEEAGEEEAGEEEDGIEGVDDRKSPEGEPSKRRRVFQRDHICDICNRSFKQRVHLAAHCDAVHLKIKPFQCHLCEASFTSNFNLSRHLRTIHSMEKSKTCRLCAKCFFTEDALAEHVAEKHPP